MSFKNKTFAVLGLGRYGTAVARELIANECDVIAVDILEENVEEASEFLTVCKCADVTEVEVLRRLGMENVDVAIIAMATNFEATVMAVTLCKDFGVKTIIAKASTKMQQKILKQVGADIVVFPEVEAGTRLAKSLLNAGFVDMIELSEEFSIVEIDVRPEWDGKSLTKLALRNKYGINVVAIKKENKIIVNINPEEPITKDMKLVIIGENNKLNKL